MQKQMIAILAQSESTEAANTATAVLFYLFAIMAGGSAICVAVSRNIVRMAVALLFTLATEREDLLHQMLRASARNEDLLQIVPLVAPWCKIV